MNLEWFRLLFHREGEATTQALEVAVKNPHYPTPRHAGMHARDFCPGCGKFIPLTSKGFWKHPCIKAPE